MLELVERDFKTVIINYILYVQKGKGKHKHVKEIYGRNKDSNQTSRDKNIVSKIKNIVDGIITLNILEEKN